MFVSPFILMSETFQMGLEAANVIGLRTQLIAQGGEDAAREANLMVSEKIGHIGQLFTDIAFGATYSAVCANFRTAIAANETRLSQLKIDRKGTSEAVR